MSIILGWFDPLESVVGWIVIVAVVLALYIIRNSLWTIGPAEAGLDRRRAFTTDVSPDRLHMPSALDVALHILVVEKEEGFTLLLRYNLEAAGYLVETESRGEDAERKIRENAIDLLVTEWDLPGLSGTELIRRLRARAETKTLPIIMLTHRREEADRILGLRTGADDYIVKPFSVPELLERIRDLLRRPRGGAREHVEGPSDGSPPSAAAAQPLPV
jgi:CheY-like chemotaxis protein